MQGFFLDPKSPAHLPSAAKALPGTRKLLAAFHRAERPAAFTVYVTPPSGPMARWWHKPCPKGSVYARLFAGMDAHGGSRVFVKEGYSAFQGTGLSRWLKARGILDLVVAGVMTDLCVESTVREAFEKGFRVFVAQDACASKDKALHNAALAVMARGFAYLAGSGELSKAVRS
jgi:nicotinamidase-related amidase